MDIPAIVNSVGTLLWTFVVIIAAIIILWFLWQVLQIGRALKEYGIDYIGFLRGEVHAAAKVEDVDILRPSFGSRRRIRDIIANKDTPKTLKSLKDTKK